MLPKSGSRFPHSTNLPSEPEFARAIGLALQGELGASRRAAKTVMAWAGVSDRTARMWLHGNCMPGTLHLIALSAHCRPIMTLVLKSAGYDRVNLSIELLAIETTLENALAAVKDLRGSERPG